MNFDVKSLHPLEIKVLVYAEEGRTLESDSLVADAGLNIGQCNQAFSWLHAKELIQEESRTVRNLYEITELGVTQQKEGTPEEKMLNYLREKGPSPIPDITSALGLENRDVGSAFGVLSKEGILGMNESKAVELKEDRLSDRMKSIRAILDRAVSADEPLGEEQFSDEEIQVLSGISKKRGAGTVLFRQLEREELSYILSAKGLEVKNLLEKEGITGDEIGALTSEMLADGSWRGKNFRGYSVNTPPVRVLLGRKNPYSQFLESVKDKLVSLGFEEFDGPLVETEFWNSDALFMPQFHSARDIHDVYYIEEPDHAKEIEQPYLDQVAAAHENGWDTGSKGWRYDFDRDFTRRLILRSQGTVLSAKQLPKAKIPGKYFGIVRCFRYDQVDATHLSDFYQTEGIVLGEDVNLRTLLGLLKMFATEVAGAEEVMYVPGYFPFTEPSVEVHIKHPVLGWFELGGSGIFRPEVTRPMGIDVPVLAWGLGIDRMALMSLGLNDLRELFSSNIENIRLRRSDA